MISLSAPRFRLALWAVFLAALGVFVLALRAVAHAQGVPDPLGGAQASVDGGMSLLVTYGPVIGGMYLVYSGANALLARYRASSWLAQGKRLAYVTSALGVAGAALQAQVTGAPWTVIAMAAIAAAFKLMQPTVTTPAPSSAVKAAGVMSLLLLLAVGGSAALQACAHVGPVLEHAIVDCTKADQVQIERLVAQFEPLLAGASPDWSTIESDAIAAGETIGGCALAQIVEQFLSPPAGRGAPSPEAGQIARATLERFRAQHAGGATFRTARWGDL